MIKIENVDVFGWEAAIRGMRNPKNSWDKSDTQYFDNGGVFRVPKIGGNDLKLMKTLSKAGNDHGKFLRMINVTLDITAPLYWLKEFDTYKVGTVANSCSTMHKLTDKEFTMDDFSYEHIDDTNMLWMIPHELNKWRTLYLETEHNLKRTDLTKSEREHITAQKKCFWWQMIQLLPSSYNQKRTVQLNYQVLKSMYFARKNHKLDEWQLFCEWMEEDLPYFKEVCIDVG